MKSLYWRSETRVSIERNVSRKNANIFVHIFYNFFAKFCLIFREIFALFLAFFRETDWSEISRKRNAKKYEIFGENFFLRNDSPLSLETLSDTRLFKQFKSYRDIWMTWKIIGKKTLILTIGSFLWLFNQKPPPPLLRGTIFFTKKIHILKIRSFL